MMKKDAVLVNTSRGEIVHLPSLIKALEEDKLWGVALDVFVVSHFSLICLKPTLFFVPFFFINLTDI